LQNISGTHAATWRLKLAVDLLQFIWRVKRWEFYKGLYDTDTHHNNAQHEDTQPNNTQHIGRIAILSRTVFCNADNCYNQCRNAKWL